MATGQFVGESPCYCPSLSAAFISSGRLNSITNSVPAGSSAECLLVSQCVTVAVAPGMTGDGPGAQRMAEIMSSMCIQFARTGNPNHAGLPHWRPYDLKQRATMCFDLPPRLLPGEGGAGIA